MSKINKIITNYPVELTPEEVENLSLTLSAVRTAGGGGGGEGKIYHGVGFVTVNNTYNEISLTTEANEKLNQSIPTKVSDLTDSADYQTVAGMSGYSTKAVADTLYAPISVTGDVDTLKSSSGDWNKVSEKLDTTAFSTVSGNFLTEVPAGYATETWVENKHYLSAVPDTYYTKSQTSGADQLAAAFDAILDYDVTAAAGIKITTATDNGTTTFGISMTAEPVVTDTNLSGYNGIAAAPDGTKSGWWNVGLTQDMLNVINGKEDILSFSYDGDTITAINTSAVGKEFDGVVTAGSLSGNGTINSPLGIKTDAALNLTNASAKSAVSADKANSATNAYSAEFAFYAGTEQKRYNISAKFDTVEYWMSSIEDEIASLDGASGIKPLKDEYDSTTAFSLTNTAYGAVQYVTANSGNWDNVSAKLDTTAAAQTYLDKTTYATDSATFVTSSSNTITGTKQYALTTAGWAEVSAPTIPDITANNGLSANGHTVGISTTNMAANKQYAFTTNGWAEVSTPTIPDITANNGLSANEHTIGIDNTDLVANTQYAWTTTGWTSVETAYLPTSGGTVSGQLVVSGGNNFDQQFLKITRENVNGYARLGLGQYGALALKTDDNNSHTTQVNISPNAANDQLVQVQHNGNTVGYLIPAVTATTTAGLTNDGILHIILESEN